MNSIYVILGIVGIIVGLVVTLGVVFLPTAIAFLRGNTYTRQVVIYQLLMVAASIAVGIVTAFFLCLYR